MLCNAFEYVACIYFMGQLLILHCDLIVTLSVGRSRWLTTNVLWYILVILLLAQMDMSA